MFLIYCKRGYFRWGEISWKCWQDITRVGYFHDSAPISFIKAYGFYFRVGVIFAKKTEAQKKQLKLPPHENFQVYSNWTLMTKSVFLIFSFHKLFMFVFYIYCPKQIHGFIELL